jgi:hypothetical protein
LFPYWINPKTPTTFPERVSLFQSANKTDKVSDKIIDQIQYVIISGPTAKKGTNYTLGLRRTSPQGPTVFFWNNVAFKISCK